MGNIVAEICSAYTQLQDLLVERELLIDSNRLVTVRSQAGTILSWSGSANLSYLFGEYTTLEHYLETLHRRDFSFVFSDGAIAQIFYKIEDDEISQHRLCYMPCPLSYEKEEWLGYSIDEIISALDFENLKSSLRMSSPVRFDFDSKFCDDRHAHSHVTFNKDSCRVPAYGAVSIGHFARFITRYFYEGAFDLRSDLEELRPMIYTRTLSHPITHELHFDTSAAYR